MMRLGTFAAALAALPVGALAADYDVAIQGFAFNPATLRVSVGDTVTFTNLDGASHTATALDDGFDTGSIQGGKSVTVTISEPGPHNYRCNFHPAMKGVVIAK